MRPCVWMISLAFATVLLTGCRAAVEQPATPTVEPAPVPTQTASPTTIPTEPPTQTPRPRIAYAVAGELPVNCRYGPGTYYAVVDGLEPYQSAQVAGKDFTGMWWYLHNPNFPDAFCWVASSATELEGDAESIPVTDPPFVTVSKLEVRTEPQRITVGCAAFPQYILIIAEITTNGPALVDWRWEVSTGEVTSEEPLVFTEAGTQVVQKSLVIYTPNDYWAQLRINAPNSLITQAPFVANCIP